MNASGRRRWALPLLVVLLALWMLALVVSFVVFDGLTLVLQWIQFGVVTLMLVVLIVGELRARRDGQ